MTEPTKRERITHWQQTYACSWSEAKRCELIDRIGHLPEKTRAAKKRASRKRRKRRTKQRADLH